MAITFCILHRITAAPMLLLEVVYRYKRRKKAELKCGSFFLGRKKLKALPHCTKLSSRGGSGYDPTHEITGWVGLGQTHTQPIFLWQTHGSFKRNFKMAPKIFFW